MKLRWSLVVGLAIVSGAGCRTPPPPPAEPQLLSTSTIKDIMHAMVEPSSNFLFDAVSEVSDKTGIHENAPKTDQEWDAVRRQALTLLEAQNLVVMHGRKVAKPGEKSANSAVELEPEAIQALIDGDRVAFVTFASKLQDATMVAMRAVDAKDKDALMAAGEGIDQACENCHLKYWYPNEKKVGEAAGKP